MLEFLYFFPRVGLGDPGAQMRPGVERRDSNGRCVGSLEGMGTQSHLSLWYTCSVPSWNSLLKCICLVRTVTYDFNFSTALNACAHEHHNALSVVSCAVKYYLNIACERGYCLAEETSRTHVHSLFVSYCNFL